MKAIIPVKAESQRCPRKNIRPFHDGKSLLDIKLEQVLDILAPDDVVVFTDSEEARQIAAAHGVTALDRSPETTEFSYSWSRMHLYLENQTPGDDDIALVLVTSPTFDSFADVFAAWDKARHAHDSLIVAASSRHYLVDAGGRAINFEYGSRFPYSQDLPKQFVLSFACGIAKRSTIRACEFIVGNRPYLFETGSHVDVDTEDDFALAQEVYAHRAAANRPE